MSVATEVEPLLVTTPTGVLAVDPAVVARAREIIAGRDPGPDLPDQSRLRAQLDRDHGHRVPPPTPQAIAWQLNQNAVMEYGGGRFLLCHLGPNEIMTPLAVGDEEPFAVYHALTPEEQAQTIFTDTEQSFFSPRMVG